MNLQSLWRCLVLVMFKDQELAATISFVSRGGGCRDVGWVYCWIGAQHSQRLFFEAVSPNNTSLVLHSVVGWSYFLFSIALFCIELYYFGWDMIVVRQCFGGKMPTASTWIGCIQEQTKYNTKTLFLARRLFLCLLLVLVFKKKQIQAQYGDIIPC